MLLGAAGCTLLAAPVPEQPLLAAEPAAHAAVSDADAIRQFVDGYFASFTAKDYDVLRQDFSAPFVFMDPQPRVVPRLEEVVQVWRGIRESLDSSAYATSRVAQLRVVLLGGGRALANVHWQRLRRNGSLLSEGAEFYVLTRQSGRWQFDGVMGQNLALFGQRPVESGLGR
jgi:ketosteroid isomerase-like protein